MGMSINEWKLNGRKDEYLRIGDIVERFNHIDEVYGHTPWTLEQIYSNLNILVGFEAIPKDQYEARLKADLGNILKEMSIKIEEEREDCEKLSNSYERFGIRAMAQRSQIVIQEKINNLQVNNSKVKEHE